MIGRGLLEGPAPDVAPLLLGWFLASTVDQTEVVLRLTEVEAYAPDDPASHSYRGETARNQSMFRAAGTLYVYRSYGIHWCANIVTGMSGHGAAVLLRGGEIVSGLDTVRRRRRRESHLTDGPGKLCQALGITGAHDGLDLLGTDVVRLVQQPPPLRVRATPRIGITRAQDRLWRFVAED